MNIVWQQKHLFLLILSHTCCSAQPWWDDSGSQHKWGDGGTVDPWWTGNKDESEAFLNGLLDQFKQHNQIISSSDLNLQTVIDEASLFFLGNQQISMQQLEPVDVLAPGAALYINGFYSRPESLVYTSKQNRSVRVTKNRNTGRLYSATSQTGRGQTNNLFRLENTDKYVSFTTNDIDDTMMAMYTLEEAFPPPDTITGRRSMIRSRNSVKNERVTTRSLQGTCSNYEVIEVSVVVDSLLCAQAGSAGEAESLVQSIIADASVFYEAPGLCVKLKLLDTYIFCNSGSDPIRPMLNSAGTSNICSQSNSLLEQFTSYVSQENIPGDVVHLFHAKDFAGTTTVGCAWVGTLCRSGGYNSGVNEVSFTNTPSTLAKLLAHENGHICSARHTSDTNDIMFGSLCSNCASSFGQSSAETIRATVDRSTCTSTESGVPPPEPNPVPIPTPSPVRRPTSAPVQSPTQSPIPPPFLPTPDPSPRQTQSPVTPTVGPAPRPTQSPAPPPVLTTLEPSPRQTQSPVPPLVLPTFDPTPRPTPSSPDSCQDDPNFQFIANGSVVGCSFVNELPTFLQSFVCSYAQIRNSCRGSCGSCQ